jgi:hypothetical protein
VTLTQVPRFADRLGQWFHRKSVPIWITEYGYQTRPAKPGGVATGQQAAYLTQAMRFAAGDPNVEMFIWFILRDDPTSEWKSGLVSRNGVKKPSYAAFARGAAKYDARSPQVTLEYGAEYPLVRFPALELLGRAAAALGRLPEARAAAGAAAALARSRDFPSLRALGLGDNHVGPKGARALASSTALKLNYLDLRYNRIGDAGARALAAWPGLAHLVALNLSYNDIGTEGARALAASPHLTRLRSLDLRANLIGDAGAAALAAAMVAGAASR